jgi:hypothetical protein
MFYALIIILLSNIQFVAAGKLSDCLASWSLLRKISVPPKINAGDISHVIVSDHFVPNDFAPFANFSGPQNIQFSSWAAQLANDAKSRLEQGYPFEEVIDQIRGRRKNFNSSSALQSEMGEWRFSEQNRWTMFEYTDINRSVMLIRQKLMGLFIENYSAAEPLVKSVIQRHPKLIEKKFGILFF